jgi:hypothetical protein
MNYPDILTFMRCSKECYRIFLEYTGPLSFYGLLLPTSIGIWADIFYQRYASLEHCLQQNDDIINEPAIFGRNNTIFSTYQELTLLEVAYMLRDPISIALLKRYNRTTVHKLSSTWTQYGYRATALLIAYSERAIDKKLDAEKEYNLFTYYGQYTC